MSVKKIQFLDKTYVDRVILNDFYRKYIACISILKLYCMSSSSSCIVLNVGTYLFYLEQVADSIGANLKKN